MKTTRVQSLE